MGNRKFQVILVIILEVLLCNAEEEIIQAQDIPQTFIPARDILMHQQTEAIRRIVHAKSLELAKPFDVNDSLLLSKCQEIAQQQLQQQQERSNNKIEAEAETLKNDTTYGNTTKKDEEPRRPTLNESNDNKIIIEKAVNNEDIKIPPGEKVQPPVQNIDKIDNLVPPPQPQPTDSTYDKPLYYIYPQFLPNVPENYDQKVEPSTTSSSTATPPLKYYTEKLRFVLRLPYPTQEKPSNFPWEFDKYAYYPKHLQPDFINMPVPYTPTYHMIRRLIVPSKVPGSYVVETNT